MLELGSATEPFDFRALEANGGFAWWYLDLVDDSGNGLVLIWFFGLPFLPARQETAVQVPARERPGICLAVYQNHGQVFYLLQEYAENAVEHGPDMSRICIGKNCFCIIADRAGVSLTADIETEVPGSDVPLTGTITASGPLRRGGEAGAVGGEHRWCPIAAVARGSARLCLGNRSVADFGGRAYLDRNSSTLPLDRLGIEQWRWGRLALSDREIIYYELQPVDRGQPVQAHVLSVAADGSVQSAPHTRLTWSGPTRDIYGLGFHRNLCVSGPDGSELEVRFGPPVDNGPFYLRFLLEARDPRTGGAASGVGEQVRPGRIHLPQMRPFVQMRIHRVGKDNSPWLPLFSGPSRGKLGRLCNHLAARLPSRGPAAGGRP